MKQFRQAMIFIINSAIAIDFFGIRGYIKFNLKSPKLDTFTLLYTEVQYSRCKNN